MSPDPLVRYHQAIHEAVAYAGRFDPLLPSRAAGASPGDIAELERLAGRPLPPIYVAFLLRLGANHGGLNVAFDGTTNIGEVLGYYRNLVKYQTPPLPPGLFLIGWGGQGAHVGLRQAGTTGPEVVFLDDDDEVVGLYAESLEKLLYQTAFDKYRWRTFRATALYSSSFESIGKRDQMPKAREIAHSARIYRGGVFGLSALLRRFRGQGVAFHPPVRGRGHGRQGLGGFRSGRRENGQSPGPRHRARVRAVVAAARCGIETLPAFARPWM